MLDTITIAAAVDALVQFFIVSSVVVVAIIEVFYILERYIKRPTVKRKERLKFIIAYELTVIGLVAMIWATFRLIPLESWSLIAANAAAAIYLLYLRKYARIGDVLRRIDKERKLLSKQQLTPNQEEGI